MLLMLYSINLIIAVKIAHLIIYNTANTLSSANTNLVRLVPERAPINNAGIYIDYMMCAK
jgi:hypothetical protein